MKIGVDIDLVTVQSDRAWYEWLYSMCGGLSEETIELIGMERFPTGFPIAHHTFLRRMISRVGKVSYNLPSYFPEPINKNVVPLDFWRHTGVYDLILPVDGAKMYLTKLIEDGHCIRFVTHDKGHGGRSKYNNIQRLLPDLKYKYTVTQEKEVVDYDFMVDDRNNVLSAVKNEGKGTIRFDTPYIQSLKLDVDYVAKGWKDVYNFITEEESKRC